MPELPEVETIHLSLEKKILGLIIKDIQVLNAKSFLGDPKEIIKGKIIKVWRRSKVLGIDLTIYQSSRLKTLLFHLKMSGQVIFESQESSGNNQERLVGGHPTKDMFKQMPNQHTRVIFDLINGSKLFFNDQRKFGWIKLVKTVELENINYGYSNKLGPEPLSKEFTEHILKSNLLNHKSQAIKVVIMDQTVVAGVGNIYACEACFVAGIDPRTKVGNMGDMEFKTLHEGIIRVLKNGIKYGGSTRAHFVDATGKKGLFLDHANVYNRVGKPCKICGTKIEKIKLGGRGTFFCPTCQN